MNSKNSLAVRHKGRDFLIWQSLFLALILALSCSVVLPVSAAESWSPVRGYSGELGSVTAENGVTTLKGFGGASYSGSASSGMAAEFQIIKHPASNYWFSVSLVDRPSVFWNFEKNKSTEKYESYGLVTTFTVTSTGISCSLYNITSAGKETLGTLTANTGTANVTHSLAFYQDSGKWVIVLDGLTPFTVDKAKVALGDKVYLCAGANADPAMEMKISAVYSDSSIPAKLKANGNTSGNSTGGNTGGSTGGTTSSASGGTTAAPGIAPLTGNRGNPDSSLKLFNVVRGYSSTDGISGIDQGRYFLNGYGGVSYDKAISNAVSVNFQIHSVPDVNYWYCFGLVDTPKSFWKPDASESTGLILVITENFDEEIQIQARSLTTTGYTLLATANSSKASKNTEHTLTVYRQDEKWHIVLDNEKALLIDFEKLKLPDQLYLCSGANGAVTMSMSVQKVSIDDRVTDEMKAVPESATSSEFITFTEEGALKVGDVVQGAADQYYRPGNLLTKLEKEIPLTTFILAGLAALALLFSAAITIVFFVKSRKDKSNPILIEEEQQ